MILFRSDRTRQTQFDRTNLALMAGNKTSFPSPGPTIGRETQCVVLALFARLLVTQLGRLLWIHPFVILPFDSNTDPDTSGNSALGSDSFPPMDLR